MFDLMLSISCRTSSVRILEALHIDPASGASLDKEKNTKVVKPPARCAQCFCHWQLDLFTRNCNCVTEMFSSCLCSTRLANGLAYWMDFLPL